MIDTPLGWQVVIWCFNYVMPWFLVGLMAGFGVAAIYCGIKALKGGGSP